MFIPMLTDRVIDTVQCHFDIRQKDHYEVKWFIPLVELSLEDKLLSPGIPPVSSICTVAVVF